MLALVLVEALLLMQVLVLALMLLVVKFEGGRIMDVIRYVKASGCI